jgi:hypothetical protein
LKDLKYGLSQNDLDSDNVADYESTTDFPELPRPVCDDYLIQRPFNEKEMYFYTKFMPEGYG